ncbi:MAG: hypothetical protein LBT54_08245, partial [Bifidobacteriaceae bacterium]|nr:hypothetical protein [Bifidobacteriaceae bacterium]
MTSRADAALAADLGAHIVGLVVEYPVDVPWNLTRAEAGDILAGRPASSEICVVTGGPPAKVAALVRRLA